MSKAPTGSTIPFLSFSLRGTRSGLSSNGGSISTPDTELPASAIRIVRVMLALVAVVAKDAGTIWPDTIAPFPTEAP